MNGGLLELTEAWSGAFDVHVHAIFHLSRAAIPLMRPRKEGAIIISSTAGKLATPSNFAWQAVKGAIAHHARAGANLHRTTSASASRPASSHPLPRKDVGGAEEAELGQRIPLKREGTTEQADAILMLVKNDYITGDTVTVDGGLTMRIA